jgi:uncharacterized protein (TIGR02001 family)
MTMLGAAALGLAGAPAWAQTAAKGPVVAFNAGATSDYVFRGLSQTGGRATAQGGADLTAGGLYGGVWLSGVDFGATAGDPQGRTWAEYDLYAGVRPSLGPVSLDFGVIRYGYVEAPGPAHYAYWEGKAAASRSFGPLSLGAAVFYSPEFFGKTGAAAYYELNGAYALGSGATLSGAVGRQALDRDRAGLAGYTTWNLGAGWPIAGRLAADVRYWGTDGRARRVYGAGVAGQRLAVTLKATF